MLYHEALLSKPDLGLIRGPGPGLGNLLMPISRALVGRHVYGGQIVYPTMRQVKIGTFLRREKDNRTYGGLLRGRHLEEWLGWVRSRSVGSIAEETFLACDSNEKAKLTDKTIVYEGLGNHFHDFFAYKDIVVKWITTNARFVGLREEGYDIGIHIRRGDFPVSENKNSAHCIQVEDEWYAKAFEFASEQLNKANPSVVVFTDTDLGSIRNSIPVDSFEQDSAKNAISAIYNLSRAKIIITSRSTFSMWAAFMGSSVCIWDKEFDLSTYFPHRGDYDKFFG